MRVHRLTPAEAAAQKAIRDWLDGNQGSGIATPYAARYIAGEVIRAWQASVAEAEATIASVKPPRE